MGNAQLARAMSTPAIVAACGIGSRVQNSTAALRSLASWFSDMAEASSLSVVVGWRDLSSRTGDVLGFDVVPAEGDRGVTLGPPPPDGDGIGARVFTSFDDLRAACLDLPPGDVSAAALALERQSELTKPPGSLGRLEDVVGWLAQWQGRSMPRLDHVDILVFAGNHGVTAQGVSAYPAAVTTQMVANFAAGGAAINQLARVAGARLQVIPLALETPTADFTQAPAMDEAAFLAAVGIGYQMVASGADLVCLGEMGIGNTTAAAAVAAALFGGGGARWAGRGTGVDDLGLARKQSAIDMGLARHAARLADPLASAAALGGRELAAILGAALAARQRRSRCCSTASSQPPRSRRWRSCAAVRSIMPWRRMSRPRRRIGCC